MKLKFLTNLYNPTIPNAEKHVMCWPNQTPKEAWKAQERWLSGKVLGLPQKTDAYTVQELIKMSMVGVYLPDEKETDA